MTAALHIEPCKNTLSHSVYFYAKREKEGGRKEERRKRERKKEKKKAAIFSFDSPPLTLSLVYRAV